MRTSQSLAPILGAAIFFVAAPAWAGEIAIYSTGVDNSEQPVALGTNDSHWQVQEAALGWVTPLYEKTNFCGSCGSIWVDHPIGDNAKSRPLAHPSHVQVAAPNRIFSWRQSFTLPADADPSTATIKYKVGFDDTSRNANDDGDLAASCNHVVWLNGTPYTMAATGSAIRTECEATIPAGANFVAGANVIEFRIKNLPTYYGFRWEKVSATYEALAPPLTLSLVDPADGFSTNDTTPEINGATTPGAAVTLEIRDMSNAVVQTLTPAVDAAGGYAIDAMALSDGSYTVTASATSAPNQMAQAGPHKFNIDATAPVAVITTPADGEVSTVGEVIITGTSEQGASVVVTVLDADGMVVPVTMQNVGADGSFSAEGMFAPGTYQIVVTATDALGNASTTMSSFTIEGVAVVMVDEPAQGATLTSATPTLVGTAQGVDSVTIIIDGVEVGTADVDEDGSWRYEVSAQLAEGSHTIEVRGESAGGDEVSSGEIKVNVQLGVVAGVMISSPADGATVTGPQLEVQGTGEAGSAVTVTAGGQSKTATVGDDGRWSAVFTDVAEGEQTIEATDESGASAKIVVIVKHDDNDSVVTGGPTNAAEDGCGCASGRQAGAPVEGSLWALGLAGLALWRRRRRA